MHLKTYLSVAAALLSLSCSKSPVHQDILLQQGWQFTKGDPSESSTWQNVTVPHDWAIYGPFDISNDLQKVTVIQDGEQKATLKTGRSGGLPFVGKGTYRRTFNVSAVDGKTIALQFDGAMSRSQIYLNGQLAGGHPYGYATFVVDVTPYVNKGENELEVRLENLERSSRWYSGAGLYRNVHLLITNKTHIPVWGTCIRTTALSDASASIGMQIDVDGATDATTVSTSIISPEGECIATLDGQQFNLEIANPSTWSPETPSLYKAVSTVSNNGEVVDEYTTTFGIQTSEIREDGFYLNGVKRKFQGVCNHHDLGPLGAAVNVAALRHQLALLKDMGCDAIRTSHNMPAPELVKLCDEMGIMMMLEPFDEWDIPKCENGYNLYFEDNVEADMTNFIHQYRNDPCVVLWSIGNEVPDQRTAEGVEVARRLNEIAHREDPTKPTTSGMDQFDYVVSNGFANVVDVAGFNYKPLRYEEALPKLDKKVILGSETASTVSSRGVYKLPLGYVKSVTHDDHQCSSYDDEACHWSNVPDIDFAADEDYPWCIGQFVWTGFDYLGEPTPYQTDSWPNHSSMFGIIDLASLPKDRFYLYRSVWNYNDFTLHILPHWNWEGHEGENIPVMVYTSAPGAELFLNGRSLGVKTKGDASEGEFFEQHGLPSVMARYRLMWDVPYEAGKLEVVAYNSDKSEAGRKIVCTAGKPERISLSVDRQSISADGQDLAYITVSVVDKDGVEVPDATNLVKFKTTGAGAFLATANGDATSLESFQEPQMHLFSGKLTAIVKAGKRAGKLRFEATSEGLEAATIDINVK